MAKSDICCFSRVDNFELPIITLVYRAVIETKFFKDETFHGKRAGSVRHLWLIRFYYQDRQEEPAAS